MEHLSVYNIPRNRLYEFDNYRFVWRITLYSTREGHYKAREPLNITEVYEKRDNSLICIASGGLSRVRYSAKENEFTIFDYDQGTNYTFAVTMPLKEASKDVLLMLKDSLTQVKSSRSK